MNIDLIFVVYNRLEYTKMSLASILADPTEEFSLTIWDNGSTDGTREYLSSVKDPRITRTVLARENAYLHGAFNDLCSRSSADLVGIIPNDFLVTPGWTKILAQAHADVPEFGMIGCWHYFPEDFDYERAKHKIQRFGRHQIFRHPFTGGGAGLVKLDSIRKCGQLQSSATTGYWTQMAVRGYVNGFYFPLIHVEHMDDPKSKHTCLKDEASYQAAKKVTVNINSPGQETLAGRWRWRQQVLNNLLDEPWDVKYYVGWRGKLRRIKKRIIERKGIKA